MSSHGHTFTDKITKRYYHIGVFARALRVKTSLIRFWLREFGIEIPRSRNGFRQFTRNDWNLLKEIYYLVKVRKFTIAGAKLELELIADLSKKHPELMLSK